MAKRKRRVFSLEEKAHLIAEVDRLYQAGGRTYRSITRELGIGEASYFNWVAAGIKGAKPVVEPRKSPGVYSADQRAQRVTEVEHLLAAGQTLRAACRTVGIGEKSFRAWRAQGQALAPMRPVEVTALVPTALTLTTAKPGPTLLTLVAPGGYRIEGLAVTDAAALLKALS